MSKTSLCKKPHDGRSDLIPCNTICVMCDVLNRNGSKIFRSSYALRHHVTTEHDRQDEIQSGVTRKQVICMARAVSIALKWNVLLDLPKRRDF